jgi:hypothetical protein
MEKFAFISWQKPTETQLRLAEEAGIKLIPIGDCNAFSVSPSWVDGLGDFSGVVVVHPAAAMRLAGAFLVGVFGNANHALTGVPPSFEVSKLEVYDLRD